VIGGTHQLFVGQAALLLQQAESGIDFFYLLLDFFVIVETEGDFGFTEVIQFFPGFAGALADDANVIGCLVGGLGEVMQALGLVISAEAVPFLPQLCSGIGQLSGFAAGITDALNKAVEVLHPVHTGGNQEFGGYSVGHGNTIMGRWCHCLWRGLMPLVAAFQRTKKGTLARAKDNHEEYAAYRAIDGLATVRYEYGARLRRLFRVATLTACRVCLNPGSGLPTSRIG